jgi:hypothetical protein
MWEEGVRVLDEGKGSCKVGPQFLAKLITSGGIPVSTLCSFSITLLLCHMVLALQNDHISPVAFHRHIEHPEDAESDIFTISTGCFSIHMQRREESKVNNTLSSQYPCLAKLSVSIQGTSGLVRLCPSQLYWTSRVV